MYYATIKNYNDTELNADDFSTRKSDIVDFIASETGLTKREIASEVEARNDSDLHFDSIGIRVEVRYS